MIDPEIKPYKPIWDVVAELGKTIPPEEWEKFNEKISGVDPEIKKVYEYYKNADGDFGKELSLGGAIVALADMWACIKNHVEKNQNEAKQKN